MDDLQLLSCFLVALSLFLCALLNANRISAASPPGPWRLPALGSIHHFISLSPPHRRLTYLARKYGGGDVLGLQIGQFPLIVVSSPEAAKQVLTGTGFLDRLETLAAEIFSYKYRNLVFSPHGQHWSKLRRICDAELLRPERVRNFRKIREKESANFIRSMPAGEIVDLTERIFSLVMAITLGAAFGDGEEKREIFSEFVAAIKRASELSGGFDVCDVFPAWPFSWYRSSLRRTHEKLDKILDEIIARHMARKAEEEDPAAADDVYGGRYSSLIDVLLEGRENFQLTYVQIKAVILDLFGAGTETTSITIEWAMSELMRNPDAMQAAQSQLRQAIGNKSDVEEDDLEKLHFLDSIVKETLRLHPPAPLIPRQASRDAEILGRYHVPHKTRVLVNAWAIGRDPRHWPEPEEFRPERFDGGSDVQVDYKGKKNNEFSFIPFGAGVRVCPGIWFAKVSVVLPLARLLFHFDWKMGGGGMEVDMSEGNGATVGRKNHLRLIPKIEFQNREPGKGDLKKKKTKIDKDDNESKSSVKVSTV